MSTKSKKIDLLLCLFLGVFGIHRFYERKIVTGIIYLFTFGFLGLGVLIDLIQIICGCRTDKNKLPIGKPTSKNRTIIKTISIVLAIILWFLIGFLFLKHALNAPMVKAEYYKEVNAAFPLEKKYTKLGEFETSFIEVESKSNEEMFDTYKIWYPSELEQNTNKKYPIVVFANGTGVPFSKYSPIFEHLASWGFVVIGNNDSSSWTGLSSSQALKFITDLNYNSKSIFYNKLDTKNIGISGHSQGGVGAINAVTNFTNSNMFTSIYTASATSTILSEALKWSYDISKIKIPYFMVAGTGKTDAETITPLDSLTENYDNLNNGIPAVMARRSNVDHGNMLAYADGYMTAWFRFTLMNDDDASKVFRGDSPEIVENTTNWQDVLIKNMY